MNVGDLIVAPAASANLFPAITLPLTTRTYDPGYCNGFELQVCTEFDRCADNNLCIQRVGEVVEARDGEDGERWYSGVIDNANVQGTYAMRYDDGELETGVRRENIKSRRASRRAAEETLENKRMRKLESLHSTSLDPAVKQKCVSSITRTYSKGEGRKKESRKGAVAGAQVNTKPTLTRMAHDVKDKRPLLRATDSQRHKYLNAPVRKQFFPGMWYEGKVTQCWKSKGIELFHIKYEDDDEEDVDREELMAILRKEEKSAAAPAPFDRRRHEDYETRKYASTSSNSNAMPPAPRQTLLVDEGGEGENEVENNENYEDE
jgi:hypothetical protein